jgi:hypothetical protein
VERFVAVFNRRFFAPVMLAIALAASVVAVATAAKKPGNVDVQGDSPAARAQRVSEQQRYEREKARRKTPEAKAERQRSRSAHGNASKWEAIELAKQKFPSETVSDVWPELRVRDDERVEGYEGRFSVRVSKKGEDGDAIVESNVPLQAEGRSGTLEPVELALEDKGDHLRSKNPIVGVKLFKQGGRAEFERTGISVAPADVEPAAAVDAETVSDRVFVANAYSDTDYWIAPTPTGFETFHQLRSQASPEELTLNLSVPAGGSARLANDGSGRVEILDATGKIRAGVGRAVAYDADRKAVPVEYALTGTRLTMLVPHRAGDYLYPIVVDPDFIEGYDWEGYPYGEHHSDLGGWQFNAPWGGYGGGFFAGFLGRGLYIGAPAAQFFYEGIWAQWQTYPYRSAIRYPRFEAQTSLDDPQNTFKVFVGLHTPWANASWKEHWGSYRGYWDVACVQWDCGWDTGPGELAYFGVMSRWSGARGYTDTWGLMHRAYIFNWDVNAPVNTMSDSGTRAWAHADSISLDGQGGTDWGGIGMRYLTVGGAGIYWEHWGPACEGSYYHQCPEALNFPAWTVNSRATEGSDSVWGTAYEKTGRKADRHLGTFRIDRTQPRLSNKSGDLNDKRGGWLKAGTHEFGVSAVDDWSGVKDVELHTQIAGTWAKRDGTNRTCDSGSGCTRTLDRLGANSLKWNATASDPNGPVTIDVIARDPVRYSQGQYAADHVIEDIFTVSLDTRAPQKPALSGPLAALNGKAVRDGSYGLDVSATDPTPGSGISAIKIYLDGVEQRPSDATRSCPASGCGSTWTRSWDFVPTSDGERTITVKAFDLVGNETASDQIKVVVDRRPADMDLSGTLFDADGSVVTGPSYDLHTWARDPSVSASLPASGVDHVSIAVDGGTPTNVACSANPCDVDWTFDARAHGDGDHDIDITAVDKADNEYSENVFVTVRHVDPLPAQSLDLTTAAGQRVAGGAAGDAAGTSAADVGDVNGDGLADYLVGAPGFDYAGRDGSGAAFLVLGGDGSALTLAGPDARYVRFGGAAAGDRAGTAVAPAGDVNGDEYPDVVVGAPHDHAGALASTAQGRAYVIFGGPQMGDESHRDIDLGALGSNGFTILGPQRALGPGGGLSGRPGKEFGAQFAAREASDYVSDGDLNGDGLDDVVIGASAEGRSLVGASGVVYVIYGRAGTATVDLTLSGDPGSDGFRVFGALADDRAGESTTVVGDSNDDGFGDLALVAPGADVSGRLNAGSAYVVYGRSDDSDVDLGGLGANGYAITGGNDARVTNVATAADVTGDDRDDLLVGGSEAWLVHGQATNSTVDLAGAFAGTTYDAPSGYGVASVAGAGDVDGDLVPDLIVGFAAAENGAGAGWVVYGTRGTGTIALDGLAGQHGTRLAGSPAGAVWGTAVDGVEAVALDGVAGYLVSAPNASPDGRSGAGSTLIGDGSALVGVPVLVEEPEDDTASGASLSAAAASTSSVQRDYSGGCWKPARRAFPYPFPLKDKKGKLLRLPACRKAVRGTRDEKSGESNLGAYADHLQPNPDQGSARKWPIADSFGNPFAWVQEIPYDDGRVSDWIVFKQDGTTEMDRAQRPESDPRVKPPEFQVQGGGCMATKNLESQYAIAGLESGYAQPLYGMNLGQNGKYIGVRGFVPRAALPDVFRNGKPKSDIDRKRQKCGSPKRYRRLRPASVTLRREFNDSNRGDPSPLFYQGRSSVNTCALNPYNLTPAGAKDRKCGAPYANYFAPDLAPDVVLLTGWSTAIQPRGGVVKAVVRTGQVHRLDYLGYSDPNVPCGQQAVATWWFVNANLAGRYNPTAGDHQQRIYGWIPRNSPEGSVRTGGKDRCP